MTGQSHAPQLLLTRPLAQCRRFARELRVEWGGALDVTISPLMTTVYLRPTLQDRAYQALIFSSETGVAAYGALPKRTTSRAFCVGDRTARAARKAGLQVIAVGEDAAALVGQIIDAKLSGPMLHVRGEDTRGDMAGSLDAAGILAEDIVIYRQEAQPLTRTARRLLAGKRPVILPLFSPRSAILFGADVRPIALLHVVAMSKAVAAEISPHLQARVVIAKSPTGPAMVRAVVDLLMEPPFA